MAGWRWAATFYSADAHLVERFTMKDSNTIDWTLTVDDPEGVHPALDDDIAGR